MKQKNFLLLLLIAVLCITFCGCKDTRKETESKFRLSNAYSYEGEFGYFNTSYKYTAYSFMINYVYTGDEAIPVYGFNVTNKNDEKISAGYVDVLMNGVRVSTSYSPYLIKGATLSAILTFRSSTLQMINDAYYYDEFSIELYIHNNDAYTVLASQKFTLEQVKLICSSTNN